jgi:hypothetical protein
MKGLAGVVVLVAITLAVSACAASHGAAGGRRRSTIAPTNAASVRLVKASGGDRLPTSLQKRIAAKARRVANSLGDTSVKDAQVYGPAPNAGLEAAWLGQRVNETAHQRKADFYLIVLHGHFVCQWCPRPPGAESPRGTIAAHVWSPTRGDGLLGLRHSLAASMSRLGKPTVISLG